jgi:hypothetical protein
MVSFLESELLTRENRVRPTSRTRVRGARGPSRRKIELGPPEEIDFNFDFFLTETTSSLTDASVPPKQRGEDPIALARASLKSSMAMESVAPEIDSVVLYSSITKAPAAKQTVSAVFKAKLDLAKNTTDTKPIMKGSSSNNTKSAIKQTFKSKSKSSTMPGFIKSDGLGEHVTARTTTRMTSTKRRVSRISKSAKLKRRELNGEALYKKSSSVPDSLRDYAQEIHAISRVSPKEEIELGTKTQEAVRLQKMYDDLQQKYGRDPTDDEWCAAAGKINMEALKEALQAGNEAKNQLVASNLRMVQRVVNLYIRNGLGSEYNAGDLMQDGTMVSFDTSLHITHPRSSLTD